MQTGFAKLKETSGLTAETWLPTFTRANMGLAPPAPAPTWTQSSVSETCLWKLASTPGGPSTGSSLPEGP